MVIAAEYIKPVGIGVTAPQFFRGLDGRIYIVKLCRKEEHTKVLANEWLGARLAQVLELPLPTYDQIEISAAIINRHVMLQKLQAMPGLHFASVYLADSEYVTRRAVKEALTNCNQLVGILFFDHLFCNRDRAKNRKNLLMAPTPQGYQCYAIDHSHFCGSGKWSVATLEKLGPIVKIYYGFLFGFLLQRFAKREDFIPYLTRVKAIDAGLIDSILQEIPEPWLRSSEERQALAAFIQQRCGLADKIFTELCRQIPVVRGGTSRYSYRRIKL
ncbi:MAG: HipA family kinase [Sporomusaceae bacterium]|nr:HipA family kinase [Sporomusaceae bacterium]